MSASSFFGLSAIGQVSVTTHDLDRAVAFYRDQLGMRYLFSAPGMAFFALSESPHATAAPRRKATRRGRRTAHRRGLGTQSPVSRFAPQAMQKRHPTSSSSPQLAHGTTVTSPPLLNWKPVTVEVQPGQRVKEGQILVRFFAGVEQASLERFNQEFEFHLLRRMQKFCDRKTFSLRPGLS